MRDLGAIGPLNPLIPPAAHRLAVPALLGLTAALAIGSLLGDSITYDETSHLASGVSYWQTGDFRLAPEHPPLAKLWAASLLPLLGSRWPPPDTPGWREGDFWQVGRAWFAANRGEGLLTVARCMMVLLLLGTCAGIYGIARKLFGPDAGLLSLILAALSPTLLAHGRYVTTDLPMAACALAALWTFARLLERITPGRLLASAAALGALSLVKFSWPLVIPALVAVGAVAILRREPLFCAVPGLCAAPIVRRPRRCLAVAGLAVLQIFFGWLAIWTCYGWNYSPFRGDDRPYATMFPTLVEGRPFPETMSRAWEHVLLDYQGQPLRSPVTGFARWARDWRLLPEAYLYGLAFTAKTTTGRWAFLAGEYSTSGWWYYFPIALLIKTPLATLLLIAAGLAATARRRVVRPQNGLLVAGLVSFACVYALFALRSPVNIGHRHLLPLYPILLVFAGGAAAWARQRAGRWAIGAALAWLLLANLSGYPHYLCYFNELIGGPRNGHRYLADSNIDWGQDLKRLARYARRHSDEPIKLAYFGSMDPRCYGIDCELLPSSFDFTAETSGGRDQARPLTGGTYVISVTQLLGVYDVEVRDEFWTPPARAAYGVLQQMAAAPTSPDEPAEKRREREMAAQEYADLSRKRLLNQLSHRSPDERIGYSLFVYRLSDAELEALLRP